MRVHPRDLSVISLYNIIAKYHCKIRKKNEKKTNKKLNVTVLSLEKTSLIMLPIESH